MTSVEIPTSVAAALPSLSVFDITNDVGRELHGNSAESGLVYVVPNGPMSLVRVTERESGFFCDLENLLMRLVPPDTASRDRLLLMLLGPRSEQIPFVDRQMCLGQWQRVLLFGFDGEARADYTLTVLG
jgi:thiamine phosphate synthase YjbQ (UPF0047 family)